MNKKAGLIKTILIIIIAIAIVSYLGFDLKKVFESDQAKHNYSYVWGALTFVWENFLKRPVLLFWNIIVIGIFWNLILLPLLHVLQSAQK